MMEIVHSTMVIYSPGILSTRMCWSILLEIVIAARVLKPIMPLATRVFLRKLGFHISPVFPICENDIWWSGLVTHKYVLLVTSEWEQQLPESQTPSTIKYTYFLSVSTNFKNGKTTSEGCLLVHRSWKYMAFTFPR